MDHGIQKYLKILNESETHSFETDKNEINEAITRINIFEDNNLSRRELAKLLTVNEEDVDSLFSILGKNESPESTLNEINSELIMNGMESISPDNSDDVFHYLRNGDLYKHTIIFYNDNYYIGSIGSLMESNFDISRLKRIK